LWTSTKTSLFLDEYGDSDVGARLRHCEKPGYEWFPVAEIDPALSAQGPPYLLSVHASSAA